MSAANKKLDQWVCFWSVPFFYNVFGIVFVPLSWMMPPRPPNADIASKVAFMQSPSLLVACVFLVIALGLAAVSNGVYLSQIKRMTVSPVFRITFLAATVLGAIVGALFPMFCFGLGSFRLGYRPEILAMLYDFGYLSFIGCLGCFFVTWSCFGLAIVLDEKNVLPKWLGYYTLWQAVTEIFATTVWASHEGPFAWNGLLAFWFDMTIYVPWQMIVYVCIYQAIRRQPVQELDNCQSVPIATYL